MQRPIGPRAPPGRSDHSLSHPGVGGPRSPPPISIGPRPPTRSTKPKLGVIMPTMGGLSLGQDSPTEDMKPVSTQQPHEGPPTLTDDTENGVTMKPPSTTTQLPPRTKSNEPLDVLRDLLNGLENNNSSNTSLPTTSSSSDLPAVSKNPMDDEVHTPASPPLTFSDEDLIEISRLGEGAGGAVHKVQDKRTKLILARKTVTTREAPLKQLLREVLIISSNSHINIIKFFGAYMSPSSSEVKIVMEYCEGGSLEAVGRKIRERGAVVGEKTAGRLAEGVLQGLAYLHTKKTIHRDIKPSNILLSREGIVKLADFGVSGELVGSNAGTFTGTSFYMAPERITGETMYTIRSDVWSTGISLLELVQNRFPYPTDAGPIELMMCITTSDPPRLENAEGVQWSEEMKDFIAKSLSLDPMKRPTPREMLEHPWIVNIMKQEAHMAKWIRQVWGWSKSSGSGSRRSREQNELSTSRPSSSRSRTSLDGSPQNVYSA